jgi:hypothetical protein
VSLFEFPITRVGFKSTRRREEFYLCLQFPPGPYHAPFCISLAYLLINSLYAHISCQGFFPAGCNKFGSLLITYWTSLLTECLIFLMGTMYVVWRRNRAIPNPRERWGARVVTCPMYNFLTTWEDFKIALCCCVYPEI